MTPEELESARAELRSIAAGLRGLLEWHEYAGTDALPAATSSAIAAVEADQGRVDAGQIGSGRPDFAQAPTPAPQRGEAGAPSPGAPIPRMPAATRAAAPAPPPMPAVVELSLDERVKRLDVLRDRVAGCTSCVLHETRTQTVFARGNPAAELCFVGEGPGEDEDVSGVPFVGRAGQLLDKMIAGMGLTSDEVYICNVVKCRPPNNRNPLPGEMTSCAPFITEQLELARPKVIVTLGNIPLKGLCGVEGITKLRGTWRLYRGSIPVMPTYHPSYVLRTPTPQVKREVWSDLREVLKQLGREPPARRSE